MYLLIVVIIFWLREEVFGPVATLLRFKTEDEAISIANDTNAGLSHFNVLGFLTKPLFIWIMLLESCRIAVVQNNRICANLTIKLCRPSCLLFQ